MSQAKESVKFKIKGLPVSENQAVRSSSRGGYKTKEYKEWERLVLLTLQDQVITNSDWYGCEIILHFPLFFKNGNIRKKDGHNMVKYAVDTTIKKITDENGDPIDDCRILECYVYKVDSEEELTEITFYTMGL